MSSDKCTLQYYYPTDELRKKYKINCTDKFFLDHDNIEMFNNETFLKFVEDKYGDSVFQGDSPFTFKDDYLNLTNEEICNTDEYSLKPQQKFVGQFINPTTNFNNTLVFHGLGSGKTCTSIVIGEAFKTTTKTRLLYVVPAQLVQQYRDEIIGELKNYTQKEIEAGKTPEIWSCTSQCEIKGKRDFYTNVNDRIVLKSFEEDYNIKKKEHEDKILEIENSLLIGKTLEEIMPLKKKAAELENTVKFAYAQLKNKENTLLSKVTKVFQIESHVTFINKLFFTTKDGVWTKMELITEKDKSGNRIQSPLLSDNGVLIIDEIQRLVSESGTLYNKLFTAIYQYINPKCRIVALSATPIYDNPYELALTMNLLRPRVPFPLNKDKFYSFFLGKYESDESDKCIRVKTNNYISNDSCVINKNLLRLLSAGYVSYFRGGNPTAYPYKRIIIMEHKMAAKQKEMYIDALSSDMEKDKNLYSKILKEDQFLISPDKLNENQKDDSVSGIYVTTQQFSNIALPISDSDVIDNILSNKAQNKIKDGLKTFKLELTNLKAKNPETVFEFLRKKGYSEKFVNIIELSLKCNGPVFIFSNWLQFGVQALAIILDACGFSKYPTLGEPDKSYFVWSSETSSNKELVNKAKGTFNSMDNKNGSLLKIILGTRSIMEGVSFKNVKQVHITDPWWNEARIEQILARAVRFCSHSNLPLEEQYTDIFRHYTVLPMVPDPEILEIAPNPGFKQFAYISIEQKMAMSSLKKYQINNSFEETLKQVAYDCDLNKKGNIIRLEENIKPLPNSKYQIYFKNPKTLETFIREEIPDEITFEDVINRTYSYPNDTELPVKFYEVEEDSSTGKLVKIIDPDTEDFNILQEPEINRNLTMYENIKCWKSDLTLEKIFDKINENPDDRDIIEYLMKIKKNFELYKILRTEVLGEKKTQNKIEFKNVEKILKGKKKLLECLKKIAESPNTDIKQKKQIIKLLKAPEALDKINSKIVDIVYKYKYLPEDTIESLQTLDTKSLNDLLKEAKEMYLLKQEGKQMYEE
jgi:hypothetical protein